MAMNLSEHICQCSHGFITHEELNAFCARHAIVSAKGKKNLAAALESIGAKKGFVKWNGSDEVKKAYLYVLLLDFSLHKDKEFWGKGVVVWE